VLTFPGHPEQMGEPQVKRVGRSKQFLPRHPHHAGEVATAQRRKPLDDLHPPGLAGHPFKHSARILAHEQML
jgi:hypothetical protein